MMNSAQPRSPLERSRKQVSRAVVGSGFLAWLIALVAVDAGGFWRLGLLSLWGLCPIGQSLPRRESGFFVYYCWPALVIFVLLWLLRRAVFRSSLSSALLFVTVL